MKEQAMPWWERWLLRRKHVVIGGDCVTEKGPLMIRFFLIGWRKRPALLVHCFFRSDMNRSVHDHPWSFITLPLQSYIEHLPDGTAHLRKAWRPLYRPAEWQHWIEVTRPRTWTICLRFKTRREWGFSTPDGWIHYKAFNYEKDC